MKIAVIGSRSITVNDIGRYLPEATEIVSGGAKGVDSCAADFSPPKGGHQTKSPPQGRAFCLVLLRRLELRTP